MGPAYVQAVPGTAAPRVRDREVTRSRRYEWFVAHAGDGRPFVVRGRAGEWWAYRTSNNPWRVEYVTRDGTTRFAVNRHAGGDTLFNSQGLVLLALALVGRVDQAEDW